jgi:hypothetical protein
MRREESGGSQGKTSDARDQLIGNPKEKCRGLHCSADAGFQVFSPGKFDSDF